MNISSPSPSSSILAVAGTTQQVQEESMPQISMLRLNQGDEEAFKSLPQYSSISAVKPSCTYNIFRLWFGAEGIMNYMLWANLIQDHQLNPSSNVHLIIDSEDHNENTNKKIKDLSKEFGINLLDINCPASSYNTIITPDLVEEIKQCKNNESICYARRKNMVQVSLCKMVPYCATFDVDTRLLKPIDDIVTQKEKAYNDSGVREKSGYEFRKIIIRMKECFRYGQLYQNTNDIMLDAFINAREKLIKTTVTTCLYQIGFEGLCVDYAKDKNTAFNCFDNEYDILKVPVSISPQKKEELYAKLLFICDREVYEQQKELVNTYLSKFEPLDKIG